METERVTISGNVRRNPFSDAAIDELVGKTITGTGIVADGHFIMDRWDVGPKR